MLPSSRPTRLATSHFSLQVFTNSRYFWRLSKKRKLRCGSSVVRPEPAGAAGNVTVGRLCAGGASNRMRRRAGAASEWRAMKPRMRSSVSVVIRPPLRRRLASLPSFTARRPKVDSAKPRWRQNSLISWRICSFMTAFPFRLSRAVLDASQPSPARCVNGWERWAKWVGRNRNANLQNFKDLGRFAFDRGQTDLGNCPLNGQKNWATLGARSARFRPFCRVSPARSRRKPSRFRPARGYRSDRPARFRLAACGQLTSRGDLPEPTPGWDRRYWPPRRRNKAAYRSAAACRARRCRTRYAALGFAR